MLFVVTQASDSSSSAAEARREADAARKASLAALYKTIHTNPGDKGSSAAARRQDVKTLRAAAKAYRARQKLAARDAKKSSASSSLPSSSSASASSSSARSGRADLIDSVQGDESSEGGDEVIALPQSPCLEGITRLEALAAAQRLEAVRNGTAAAASADDLADLPFQRDDSNKIDYSESVRGRPKNGGGSVKQKFLRVLEASSLARLFNRVRCIEYAW